MKRFFVGFVIFEILIFTAVLVLPAKTIRDFLGVKQGEEVLPAFRLKNLEELANKVESLTSTKILNDNSISPTPSAASSAKVASSSVSSGLPTKIYIQKIGVGANIEHVGLDKEKRMDVPKNFANAAWYNLGYKVGENGSAVITGHLDNPSGGPAVFWNLSKLNKGDLITVYDTTGKEHKFTVSEKVVYAYDKLPLQKIFGTPGTPSLNLITCSGTWDRGARNYSTRTVIYAAKI